MRIAHIEIANFRKLLAVRIELSNETTVFVGANNSGKTSAMLALRYFLTNSGAREFCVNDFTLSHWASLNKIGKAWGDGDANLYQEQWHEAVPTLDLWLDVGEGEIHHVSEFLPTLDWNGGSLGIRLRFQPKDINQLRDEYIRALKSADSLRGIASEGSSEQHQVKVPIWPTDMMSFLGRRLDVHFAVHAFALDPGRIQSTENGFALLQSLPNGHSPVELASLKKLIVIDEINAQRLMGGEGDTAGRSDADPRSPRHLSMQLRSYYSKHLNPSNNPEPSDLKALEAIEKAKEEFDRRLETGFGKAFKEIRRLGYPGVADPNIKISTRLEPTDGLDHDAAVQYEVGRAEEGDVSLPLLPEKFLGLGYRNLISMSFRLMSFRDAWMRVGKAGCGELPRAGIPPLHLVLVEEPESHLHAQVQQVFIEKAYSVLRDHPDLGSNSRLRTQLVVSTHSSHIAHAAKFSSLRYFRRLLPGKNAKMPVSLVINLSTVFGEENENRRFVMRYLKAQHCDLFFADAAILVEGPAERILVPHFIETRFKELRQRYITLLEIGGSHAHRLRPLIEKLGLLTLVITDLDAADSRTGKSQVPARGKMQSTTNPTLKDWIPALSQIDDLCELEDEKKVHTGHGRLSSIRVAYQKPLMVPLKGENAEEIIPSTFEDALAFQNLSFFCSLKGAGLAAKFKHKIDQATTAGGLADELFEALRGGKKAELALDIVNADHFDSVEVPAYIAEGLDWLTKKMAGDPPTLAQENMTAEATT